MDVVDAKGYPSGQASSGRSVGLLEGLGGVDISSVLDGLAGEPEQVGPAATTHVLSVTIDPGASLGRTIPAMSSDDARAVVEHMVNIPGIAVTGPAQLVATPVGGKMLTSGAPMAYKVELPVALAEGVIGTTGALGHLAHAVKTATNFWAPGMRLVRKTATAVGGALGEGFGLGLGAFLQSSWKPLVAIGASYLFLRYIAPRILKATN